VRGHNRGLGTCSQRSSSRWHCRCARPHLNTVPTAHTHGTHPRHTPTRTDKTTHRKETNEKFSSPSDDANGDWAGQNDTDVLFWALEPLSVARPSPQRHWPRQSRPTRRRPCPSSNHLQKIQIPFQPFLSYFSNDDGALSSASCRVLFASAHFYN